MSGFVYYVQYALYFVISCLHQYPIIETAGYL